VVQKANVVIIMMHVLKDMGVVKTAGLGHVIKLDKDYLDDRILLIYIL
jgi:hypothetical protein